MPQYLTRIISKVYSKKNGKFLGYIGNDWNPVSRTFTLTQNEEEAYQAASDQPDPGLILNCFSPKYRAEGEIRYIQRHLCFPNHHV